MRQQDKEAERSYYNRYGAEFTEGLPESLYERWLKVAGLLEASPAEILEAACGAGHFGYQLARRGHRVTGVDLSTLMVKIANRNAPAGFRAIAGDMEDPGLFDPQQFDAVFFGQALHHFPDTRLVLQNAYRWLKPGGQIILIEPNGSNPVNALGKFIGRILALNPAFQKSIGTVNEVSLPVGSTVRALRNQGFSIDLEHMEAEIPKEIGSGLMGILGRCRVGLYALCLRLLPRRMSGIQFIVRARKPEQISAVLV